MKEHSDETSTFFCIVYNSEFYLKKLQKKKPAPVHTHIVDDIASFCF